MQTLTCISKAKLFTWIKEENKTANQKKRKKKSDKPKEKLRCV